MNLIRHIPLSLLLLGTLACDDSSDNGEPDGPTGGGDPYMGEAVVVVSGAIEREHECGSVNCPVFFGEGEYGSFGFRILMGTYSSFSLEIKQSNEHLTRLEPGTYDVSEQFNTSSFGAVYFDDSIQDDRSFETHHPGAGGTLTIETSTPERVTGSFELVAANGGPDDDAVETITVTGEFVAVAEALIHD
jgi:hypothetical protein